MMRVYFTSFGGIADNRRGEALDYVLRLALEKYFRFNLVEDWRKYVTIVSGDPLRGNSVWEVNATLFSVVASMVIIPWNTGMEIPLVNGVGGYFKIPEPRLRTPLKAILEKYNTSGYDLITQILVFRYRPHERLECSEEWLSLIIPPTIENADQIREAIVRLGATAGAPDNDG